MVVFSTEVETLEPRSNGCHRLQRLAQVFADTRPELVFHAAAVLPDLAAYDLYLKGRAIVVGKRPVGT